MLPSGIFSLHFYAQRQRCALLLLQLCDMVLVVYCIFKICTFKECVSTQGLFRLGALSNRYYYY